MANQHQPYTGPDWTALIQNDINIASIVEAPQDIQSSSQAQVPTTGEYEHIVGPLVSTQNVPVHTDMEKLVQASNLAMYTPLSAHHTRTMGKFQKLESQVDDVGRMLARCNDEARERTDLILKTIQQSHEAQHAKMKMMSDEMEALRRDVGKSEVSANSGESISARLAGLEMDVQEVAERVRDPEAFLPSRSVVRHEIGTSPHVPYGELPSKVDGMAQTEEEETPPELSQLSRCTTAVAGEDNPSLFPSHEVSPMNNRKILDQFAAELHLKSFDNEPIFRTEVISRSYLETLHSRFSDQPSSPSPESLITFSWSESGTPPDSVSLTAVGSTPRTTTSGKLTVDDEESLETFRHDNPSLNLELENGRLTPLFSPKCEEGPLPTHDGFRFLPSPAITHITSPDEGGVIPSRTTSPFFFGDNQSPARSLSPLSSLSSLADSQEDEYDGVTSAGPSKDQKDRWDRPQGSTGKQRKGQDTSQRKKRRGKNGDIQGPSKRRKSLAKSATRFDNNHLKEDPSQVWCNQGWPPIVSDDKDFHRKFVQCDNCDVFYHYGCVGIEKGDPRLQPVGLFLCPPCAGVPVQQRLWRRGTNDAHQPHNCGRSDCGQTDTNDDEFFVERIIGRRPRLESSGHLFCLLSYHVKDATWSTDEDIGDAGNLIEEFENAARRQKLSLRTQQAVLLKEGPM